MALFPERLLDRIASEYEIGGYGTGTFETAEHRIIYVETGREGILLLICHYEIDLKRILPLAYLVAEKIIFDSRYICFVFVYLICKIIYRC